VPAVAGIGTQLEKAHRWVELQAGVHGALALGAHWPKRHEKPVAHAALHAEFAPGMQAPSTHWAAGSLHGIVEEHGAQPAEPLKLMEPETLPIGGFLPVLPPRAGTQDPV
jgi:hypothetical protein